MADKDEKAPKGDKAPKADKAPKGDKTEKGKQAQQAPTQEANAQLPDQPGWSGPKPSTCAPS